MLKNFKHFSDIKQFSALDVSNIKPALNYALVFKYE